MKDFLIDVPVQINIWIRPECQRKQFDVIKKVRPSIIFLVSDGGRNDTEWEAIKINRKLYDENVDWNCKIYKLYADKNYGLYEMEIKKQELVWSNVDRCIFLEDDILPNESFFKFCKELLEKYKDDYRINVICGMNHLGFYNKPNTDYFFTRQGSIWGFATWKRVFEQYYDFSYHKDNYIMDLLKERTKNNKIFYKRIIGYSKEKLYEGHIASTEYFFEFGIYGQNQLQIVPTKNLISNIGATNDSAHFSEIKLLPRGLRKIFNMKTYELGLPLKHPQYVIPDVYYEKKRNSIMGYNVLSVRLYRNFEQIYIQLRYGNLRKWLLNKFNRLVLRQYKTEK